MNKRPIKTQKSTRMARILRVVLAIVVLLGGIAAWRAWAFAIRPLNLSLADIARLPTSAQPAKKATLPPNNTSGNATPVPTSIYVPGMAEDDILPTPENYVNPTPMGVLPSPTSAANARTICGAPPVMFILTAGLNNINEADNADAVRIVRVDFTRPQVSVLSLEREIWTNIPDLEAHGITAMWFSSSYTFGEYLLGKGKGIYLLNKTIAQNFGIDADHYAVVDLTSFAKAVDMVGGVDIYLSEPVVDNVWQHIDLGAGWHHLDGDTAMRFVRVRIYDSDWQRINRQTLVFKSLFTKLTAPANLPKLPGLAVQLRDDFQTDLSPVEIGQLTCLAARLPKDQIKFYEISPDMVTPITLKDKAQSQIMLPKWDLIRPYIQQFINGTLP